jgi:hypothetical protein
LKADQQRADRAARDRDRAAQSKLKADQQRADRESRDRNKQPPRAEAGGNNRTAQHDEMRREHQKLSAEQRTRLHSAFNNRSARIRNARFDRRIGTHIPRSVRLFLIPAAAYAVFPYYRDYRYVVVDDTVCIVDPITYEIVDVIDDTPYPPGGGGQQTAQLTLTPAERAIVLDSIPPDFPVADVRLRLALGVDVPSGVELHQFAPIVLDNVPRLRDFRFLVAQGAVVIVDPRDRSVALTLDR